jgi:hypothetical protein
MRNETMTTAANVVTELQARGIKTCPLTGREFPVPMWVATDEAYRWRLVVDESRQSVLRAAFPSEPANMIEHWSRTDDLGRFSGALGDAIRQAVRSAVC